MSTDLTALRKLAEEAGELWLWLDSPDADLSQDRDYRLNMSAADARYVYAIRPATILSLLDDLARVTAERDELERRIHRARHAAEHYAGLANHDGGL